MSPQQGIKGRVITGNATRFKYHYGLMNSQGNLSEYCFSHKYELRRKFTNNPD